MNALLRSFRPELVPAISGARVVLRAPVVADYEAWADLRSASRAFLTPWEPTWPPDDLTRASFRRRLRRYAHDAREDLGYAFLVFRRADEALVGGITVSNVRRGVTQSCSIGYWMGVSHSGKGYMTDAVRALLPWLFDGLNLHRVEAATLPGNGPSQALLLRVGFSKEGYARQYLKIDGQWRDHVLYGMVAGDPRR
ncbi:GNAT family N-acetyltransferase [Zavarzinia sp. CC-PAN008]|uniref:GNAT family N-acetyltransferase n=1 Tax=Zavarzinia sp. CC-PAN008 TaxID=3243332 RepID=UPI003F74400F